MNVVKRTKKTKYLCRVVKGIWSNMYLSERSGQKLDVGVIVHHQYNGVNNQQDATTFSFINLFKSAQHVSGDKFAHPQEHFLTVYTDFGTIHLLLDNTLVKVLSK